MSKTSKTKAKIYEFKSLSELYANKPKNKAWKQAKEGSETLEVDAQLASVESIFSDDDDWDRLVNSY